MSGIALKFLSGPQQSREFPLETNREIIIGRSDTADLRIIEDTISRTHAKISFKNDEIVIEDLSKNGTFVNSRRIEKTVLFSGDVIHIGQTILRICPAKSPLLTPAAAQPALVAVAGAGLQLDGAQPTMAAAAVPPPPPRPPAPTRNPTTELFRGIIGEVGLTDLIQLLSTSRKSGVLTLRSADMLGKVFIEAGHIIYATMDEVEPVNPRKVFYRLLRWGNGTFEFAPPERHEFPGRIDESTDHLLLEAMHELDELNNLGPDLPSLHAEVEVTNPLPAPLKDLAASDLDFIQLVMRHKLVRDILDHYTGNDFEGYTYLKSLMGRHFLVITL